MRLGKTWRGVRTTYSGPSAIARDHYGYYDDWWADRPVPSRHYEAGRMRIQSKIAGAAISHLETMDSQLGATVRWNGNKPVLEPAEECAAVATPELRHFLLVCSYRFAKLVYKDVRQYVSGPEAYRKVNFIQEITAGPYEQNPQDVWHRDSAGVERAGITYALTLYGPTTQHAAGEYRRDQFYPQADMFKGVSLPDDRIVSAEAGVINAFDQLYALHQAPPMHRGSPFRIFARMSVTNVFDHAAAGGAGGPSAK